MTPEESRASRVRRLAERGVERAMGERRDFTITKFGRSEDGYFHARVTPAGGKPVYVHRKHGSWLAPGRVRGRELLKELEGLGFPIEVKVELQKKARAIERAERGEEHNDGAPNGPTDSPPDD